MRLVVLPPLATPILTLLLLAVLRDIPEAVELHKRLVLLVYRLLVWRLVRRLFWTDLKLALVWLLFRRPISTGRPLRHSLHARVVAVVVAVRVDGTGHVGYPARP